MNKEVRAQLEKQFAESLFSKIESIWDNNGYAMEKLGERNKYIKFFTDNIGLSSKESFKLVNDIAEKRIVNREEIIKLLIDKYFSKESDESMNMRLGFAKSQGKMEIPESHIKDFNDFIKSKKF